MFPRLVLPRAACVLLGALAVSACLPAFAGAHASFLGARPAPGARVNAAPAQITLAFSERLNARLSRATLIDASSGRRVPTERTVSGRSIVLRPHRALGRDPYRVDWESVSTEDGHPLEGSFGFGVRTRAAAGRSLEQGAFSRQGWLRAPLRALMYVALFLFVGGLLTPALIRGGWPGAPGAPEPARRAQAVVGDAGLAALGVTIVVVVVEAATAARGLAPAGLRDYLLAWPSGVARIALVGFVAAALMARLRSPRAAALSGAAALACVAAAGHANSADPRAVAIVVDVVHLLAAAVWLGGGALILAAWGPDLRERGSPGRRAVAREVLPRFARVAGPAFGVVVVTGTASAVIELGRVADLWSSAYGEVLLVKIGLVVAIAAAAAIHRRLRPRVAGGTDALGERRHWRALGAEPLLALGVLAAAGLLVAFPLPPRQADAAAGSSGALPGCDPCPLPTPRPDELAVADQAGSRVVAAYVRRVAGSTAVTLRVLDYRRRAANDPVRVNGIAGSGCGPGCHRYSLFGSPARLDVALIEAGRTRTASLPARWREGDDDVARRLLERAERTMRELRSVRERETVSSGPGTGAVARYALRAPDRLAYVTDRGVQAIQIGERQWLRTGREPWRVSAIPGGVPFRTRTWFRWTPYAAAVKLLPDSALAGGRRAELALMDPGTPVWIRLTVDRSTGRVLHERLVTPARFITHSYSDFDADVRIEPPADAIPSP